MHEKCFFFLRFTWNICGNSLLIWWCCFKLCQALTKSQAHKIGRLILQFFSTPFDLANSFSDRTPASSMPTIKKAVRIFIFIAMVLYFHIEETNEKSFDNRDGRHFIGGISTNFDRVLIGHNLSLFQTRGMIECAQKCLSVNLCASINYQINKRWCELNKWESDQYMDHVVYRKDFVFVVLY